MTPKQKPVALKRKLQDFRILVRKAMPLSEEEVEVFNRIPAKIWNDVLTTNFGDNFEHARRVILNNEEIIEKIDDDRAWKQKQKIDNLEFATDEIVQAINNESPILFITDIDNDGSLSQAVIQQFIKANKENGISLKNVYLEYGREVEKNPVRGISLELVEELIDEHNIDINKPFYLITADNGINSKEEQRRIQSEYKNAFLIITDHHEPEDDMVVAENSKTIIVNPKYIAENYQSEKMLQKRGNVKKSENEHYAYEEKNISGATTIAVLLRSVLEKQLPLFQDNYQNHLKLMSFLSKVSNALDYVDTHAEDKLQNINDIGNFTSRQGLLNVNNSMSKMIYKGGLSDKDVQLLKKQIPEIDEHKVTEISNKVFTLNKYSQLLLTLIESYERLDAEEKYALNKSEELEEDEENILLSFKKVSFDKLFWELISKLNVVDPDSLEYASTMLNEKDENLRNNFHLKESFDENYVGQLRPYIFSYLANDDKSNTQLKMLDMALTIFQELQRQEKELIEELRKGNIAEHLNLPNLDVFILDSQFSTFLNRKLLNKTYNISNKGLAISLDNIQRDKIAGSFRSLYDSELFWSDELKNYLKDNKLKLELPGHARAAGFIITSVNGKNLQNIEEIIKNVALLLNDQLEKIKAVELKRNAESIKTIEEENIKEFVATNTEDNQEKVEASDYDFVLTDLSNLSFVTKFNKTVRGIIPHNQSFKPLIQLNENVVYVDPKTNKQYLLSELLEKKQFGYVALMAELGKGSDKGKSLIIPTELLRDLVKNNFQDYLQMSNISFDSFIIDKIVKKEDVKNILDLRISEIPTQAKIVEAYKDNKLDDVVKYSNKDLQELAFIQNSSTKDFDFNLYQNTLIEIIRNAKVDRYTCFDVEAVGFSKAKMINLGAVDYFIDETSGLSINLSDFKKQTLVNDKGELFYSDQLGDASIRKQFLKEISEQDYITYATDPKFNNQLFFDRENDKTIIYLIENKEDLSLIKVENQLVQDDNIVINQQLIAEGLYRLIKEDDLKIPAPITNLTGITNEHIQQFGKSIVETDEFFTNHYENLKNDKGEKAKILIGAHNTNYDLGITRANTPQFFDKVLLKNKIFDTCDTAKSERLIYSNIDVVNFKNVPEIKKNIYFYHNVDSDFNLIKFLDAREGTYPDQSGKYRLIFENGELYFEDRSSSNYDRTKVTADISYLSKYSVEEGHQFNRIVSSDLVSPKGLLNITELPLNVVGYSAQSLSNQKMVSLLLSDKVENKETKIISPVGFGENADRLILFQKGYNFSKSFEENERELSRSLFIDLPIDEGIAEKFRFKEEFFKANEYKIKALANEWYYKAVLAHVDPKPKDLTKDTIEIVSELSGLPNDIVKQVMIDTIEFKQKYELNKFNQKEIHVNGPIDGDVLFETYLNINMLAKKTERKGFSSLAEVTKDIPSPVRVAVKEFNQFSTSFTNKFKQGIYEFNINDDSMGMAQLLDYSLTRKDKAISDLAQKAKDKYADINTDFNHSVIRFGLGTNVLQPNTHIYALTREDVEITPELIKEDAKKIAFCMKVKQISENKEAYELLQANFDKVLRYQEELGKRYTYLELNSRVKETKDLEDIISDILVSQAPSFSDRKLSNLEKKIHNSDIPLTRWKIFQDTLVNVIDGLNQSDDELSYNRKALLEPILELVTNKVEADELTRLENAYVTEQDFMKNLPNNFDEWKNQDNFIKDNVKRTDPIGYMLKNFSLLELTQEFAAESYGKKDLDKQFEKSFINSLKK